MHLYQAKFRSTTAGKGKHSAIKYYLQMLIWLPNIAISC